MREEKKMGENERERANMLSVSILEVLACTGVDFEDKDAKNEFLTSWPMCTKKITKSAWMDLMSRSGRSKKSTLV